MNNALSKSKYGWKNVCKLRLQEPTPYASPACSKPLDLRSLGVGGWRRQELPVLRRRMLYPFLCDTRNGHGHDEVSGYDLTFHLDGCHPVAFLI